ncbi:hypothetical protein [Streptomyces sp. NPDC005012]|uniref:TraR/DksA family transcriptional regulator n=1 Tax=Streptomyces sp. NPDC005012 TaxID=3154558 RepID=UPI0033A0AB21
MNAPTAAGDRAARHLTAEDLAVLRAALREQLRLLRGPAAPAGPASGAPARMVLADVEAALRRLDEGRYGLCHRCRLPVDRKQLLLVPQARYCAPCRRLRALNRASTGAVTSAAPGSPPPSRRAAGPRRAAGR